MVRKKNNLLLNTDELEFLSEIISADNDSDSSTLEYNLNSSVKGISLLSQLACANKLQLSAIYGNHQIIFPIEIKNGDFSSLKMALKPPEIFEIGDIIRSWRLTTNDKKVYLVNKAGDELHFKIENLSASGISFVVDPKTQNEFPTVLSDAFLVLPNHQKLALSGLKLSRVDEKRVAYSLGKKIDEAVLASLYEYLFECHIKQYPQAHAN